MKQKDQISEEEWEKEHEEEYTESGLLRIGEEWF
jgi:hypothetical protein